MRIPHPIPYQGSKRGIAGAIIECFPEDVARLVEPFAGSAAVSLAAAARGKARSFWLNDINQPLVALWSAILAQPDELAGAYQALWTEQLGRERAYFDQVRDLFNKTRRPDYLLYLLARCVKAAVRYNAKGEFNQGPDNRRKGARPATMRAQIAGAANLLGGGRTRLTALDYREVLAQVQTGDLVYMDPPYQGVSTRRDQRYLHGVEYAGFVTALRVLNERGIAFILSYDGRTGAKQYGRSLPEELELTHIEIEAGRSSQATLLGRNSITYEAIYLSPALVRRRGAHGIR